MNGIKLVLALTAAAVPVAPALAQEKNAQYYGRTAQKLEMEIRTSTTARSVTRVRFDFRANVCGFARNGAQGQISTRQRMRVRSRSFRGRGRETARIPRNAGSFGGGTQIERWNVRGRFTADGERAFGSVRMVVEIRNRAGRLVDTCRTRGRIKFNARSVGVDYELPGG